MTSPLKSKGVVVALVVVAAVVMTARFGKWPSGKPILLARARSAPAPFVEENFQVRPRLNITWEKFGGTNASSPPLRDPFAWAHSTNKGPTEAVVSGAESLVLQAISINAGRAIAVLNRRVVEVGESLGQYRIEKILPAEVWVRGPGGQLVIRLAR